MPGRSRGDAADGRPQDRELMFDLAALAIAVACFAFIFVLLYVLEKV
jgi:hypothetical protein